METINGLQDVRPGDLIFTDISEPLAASLLVKIGMLILGERVRIGRRSFDHVLIVTEAAKPVTARMAPMGDLLMTPIPGHVAPELHTPPRAVQAMPGGAEEIELTAAKHWGPKVSVCRLPEDWPGQALDAANIAREMVRVGTPYSFASYLMLALWRWGVRPAWLAARINRRRPEPLQLERWSNGPDLQAMRTRAPRGGHLPVEAICSALVDACWTLAGHEVCVGTKPQVVTPGMLAMQLWRRVGSIWGGEGILG